MCMLKKISLAAALMIVAAALILGVVRFSLGGIGIFSAISLPFLGVFVWMLWRSHLSGAEYRMAGTDDCNYFHGIKHTDV